MDTLSKISKFFEEYDSYYYSSGSTIINANEVSKDIFYVKSGRVRMYGFAQSGYKLTLKILSTGSFFALPWIYDKPNNYGFEALTKCEIIKCKIPKVREFVSSNPDVMESILIRLTAGFDGIFKRLSIHMGGSAEKRVIIELLIEAYRFNKDEKPVKIKISLNDLTSSTGLARETVSREISKLTDKKLLYKVGRTIYIEDIKLLEKELLS